MRWVLFSMDRTLGIFLAKYGAVKHLEYMAVTPIRRRKIRSGAYEYKIEGEWATEVFWVMTEAEARKEGWTGR